jgi:hypothetical protein
MSQTDALRLDKRPTLLQRWKHFWMRIGSDTGILGFGLRWGVLLLFAAYFFVPLLWLVLATSKSAPQLLELNPLAFGSFQRIQEAWQRIIEYQKGEVLLWAGAQFYQLRGLGTGPIPGQLHSGGIHSGRCAVSRSSPVALVDIDHHVAATLGPSIAHVHGAESSAFGQHPMGCHFAVSLFPLRHILDLYLLRRQLAARTARRGAGGRLF